MTNKFMQYLSSIFSPRSKYFMVEKRQRKRVNYTTVQSIYCQIKLHAWRHTYRKDEIRMTTHGKQNEHTPIATLQSRLRVPCQYELSRITTSYKSGFQIVSYMQIASKMSLGKQQGPKDVYQCFIVGWSTLFRKICNLAMRRC